MEKKNERNQAAMKIMLERGVLSDRMTLNDIVAVASEMEGLGDADDVASWTLISKDFVYKGGAIAELGEELVNR